MSFATCARKSCQKSLTIQETWRRLEGSCLMDGTPYCEECAVKINKACEREIVLPPLTTDELVTK